MSDERAFEPNENTTMSTTSLPQGSLETSIDDGQTWVDVDASWDGTGTLDEHRQSAFAKLTQPGFGNIGKGKPDGE